MDRDQLTEHLKFAAELGVGGTSRDPVWRTRAESPGLRQAQGDRVPDTLVVSASPLDAVPGDHEQTAPVTFSRSPVEALAAVRLDIGDCTRCKLHTLGRTQIVFGVGNP